MSPEKASLDDLRIDRGDDGPRAPKRALLLASVLLFFLFAAAAWWWSRGEAVAEVRTAAVREAVAGGQSTVLNASGYVTARRRATVSSKVTGKVSEVMIEEGMVVEKGQILARLDPSNVEVSLRLSRAQVEAARSSMAETRVRLAEAELERQRASRLVESQISTQSELDRAQAEFDSLEARLAQQREEVKVAERQVALWNQQLEDTVIRAPFGGVVVAKNAQPGEMISPAAAGGGFTRTGIGTLVDMDSLEIEVDVNESYINRVRPEQRVEATLDAYADWRIPARVIAIVPTADRQKATVRVRIGFDDLDPKILPDMGVKVAFQEETEGSATSAVLTVPQTAVRRSQGAQAVFVSNDGRAERRAVRLGGTQGDDVVVVAGLAAGERVVIEGPENLADGDTIEEMRGR